VRNKENFVIWTVYFNQDLSRKRGRKLPKRECVQNPKLEELVTAARKLGFQVASFKKARYPSCWWIKDNGYIMISKDAGKKLDIIREIAKEIRRMRGGK
jgi:signal recognition particle subunit SRP19